MNISTPQQTILFLAASLVISAPTDGATLAHWNFNDPDAVAGAYLPGNGSRVDLDGDGTMDQDDFRVGTLDRSGNGNHLTARNDRSLTWTAHSYAGDFSMNASDTNAWAVTDSAHNPHLKRYDLEKVIPKEWTVEALFKPAGFRENETQTIVCRAYGGEQAAFCLQIQDAGGLLAGYTDVGGIYHEVHAPAAGLSAGSWYHVAAVSDGTTLSLYLNGFMLGHLDMTGTSSNTRLAAGSDAAGDALGWLVGGGMRGAPESRSRGVSDFFRGAMDEVAVSATALKAGSFVVPVPPLLGARLENLVRNGDFDDGRNGWAGNANGLRLQTEGGHAMVGWSGTKRTGIWQDTGAVFKAYTEYRMTVLARKGSSNTKDITLNLVDIDQEYAKLVDVTIPLQGAISERRSPWEALSVSFNTAAHPDVVGHKIGVGVSAGNGILLDRVSLVTGARLVEKLDRGVVAVSTKAGVYVGWRMFGTEPGRIGYNVYRDLVKLNETPITDSTNLLDEEGTPASSYSVAAVLDGTEQERSVPVDVWHDIYKEIPLQRPAGGVTPSGEAYEYSPGDVSVGDLNGDGSFEIVLKWNPANGKDNSQAGYSGNQLLDAYTMDGSLMWRIDLGINIRAGSHYTQFMVYDLDCDGRAELVCKTADGTRDGLGTVLGDASADWRNSGGYILNGPEYLSVFDGRSGAFIDTVDYVPARGRVAAWGDGYGNRVDRFLGCVAYLGGQRPSVVMSRGQYSRVVVAAWDLACGQLIPRWVFDSDESGNEAYHGQGNHNLSVADVDGDGRDEIIYGSCAIDDDGTGLYSTGLGHGDALHVSDMDPFRPGLEVWMPHETSINGATFRDAATGEIIWDHANESDVGRGVAAHIDAGYPGYQLWSYARGGVYTTSGKKISDNYSGKMMSFLVWWNGNLQREFLSSAGRGGSPVIERWGGDGSVRLLNVYDVPSKYDTACTGGTKATPNFSGDLLGDWREEMILHSSDKNKLRIFTTTELTEHRIYTLLHDPQYRLALVWQNGGYNQPPHPGFYIGEGMAAPPVPNIKMIDTASPVAEDAPKEERRSSRNPF